MAVMRKRHRVGSQRHHITLLLCGITIVGCASAHRIPNGMLNTSGAQIEQHEQFVIKSGQLFDTPFALDPQEYDKNARWTERFEAAVNSGARRVRVMVPGRTEPLFGVLALYQVPEKATGPGARSYSIQIPQSYVDEASDGRISVVYELVPVENNRFVSWMLWLSDRSF